MTKGFIPEIAVIGAGPAGLMAADFLSQKNFHVTIYEQKPNAGRKFLLAGRSGLNLTHAGGLDHFLKQYGVGAAWLRPALESFTPDDVIHFAENLGQPCFTGTSGKIFPVGLKATQLLRAWLRRLSERGVTFQYRMRWCGFGDGDTILFDYEGAIAAQKPNAVLLALGGASWPRTGSDGAWTRHFQPGMLNPFAPANCGFRAALSPGFFSKHEGAVLHGVTAHFEGRKGRGDVTVTKDGLEGAPIYALSAPLRQRIASQGAAELHIDLRPIMTMDQTRENVARLRPRESQSNHLRRLGLSPVARGLFQEAWFNRREGLDLATALHNVPVRLEQPADMARAISVAGGVRQSAVDSGLMLRQRPGVFIAGEMLDWEAPTGGYLLQGCFSTGYLAALSAEKWLTRHAG